MYNQGRIKPTRNQKKQRIKNNLINNQNNEPKFYTKLRLSSYKIDLEQNSPKEFINLATQYFYNDLIYRKYFETGELFSLNKNSSYNDITKINNLLDELNKNEEDSPRVIFFQSPPMIGMPFILKYFNEKNFKYFLWTNSYGKDNKKLFAKYFPKNEVNSEEYKEGSILKEYQNLKERIDNSFNKNPFFIVFKNLPYDLFLMSLKGNNYTANFLRNWKPTILLLFELINKVLTSQKYSHIKFIFFTDDKEIDEFELKTLFPNNILEHPLTKIIICNPISQRKIYEILRNFLGVLSPPVFDENNYKNIIDSIYLEFGSNIQKILDYIILEVNTKYYLKISKYNKFKNTRPLTQRGKTKIQDYVQSQHKNNNISQNFGNNNYNISNFKNKKEQQLDHDLFRLLGKLLYNKRYVKKKDAIVKLKKEEFGNNFETPRYYNIDELINDIPISNNSFNDLLIYNSMDHFNDVGEYSDICELYSFTDNIDNFEAFLYDKCNQYFFNNSYMKTYLNCLGVTTYNLSQYNTGGKNRFNNVLNEKGLMTIKKPEVKIVKNINKFENNSFYKACEYFPCLISLSFNNFYKEGIYDFYKLYFSEDSDKNKSKKIGDNNGNIVKSFYKKEEKQKILEDNENEFQSDKKNNNGNDKISPKSIEMRNIPEEDRKALEEMINGTGESEDECDIIEED